MKKTNDKSIRIKGTPAHLSKAPGKRKEGRALYLMNSWTGTFGAATNPRR